MGIKLSIITNLIIILFFILFNIFDFYYFEIIISFLPYFAIIWLVVIVFEMIIILRYHLQSDNIWFTLNTSRLSFSLFTLVISSFCIFNPIFSFAFSPINNEVNTDGEIVKVVTYNKFYLNLNYNKINEQITRLDPDIISISECDKQFIEFISKNPKYPYKFISSNSGKNYPIILLSKLELVNVNSINGLDYINATVKTTKSTFNISAIHTHAPMTESMLDDRNTELEILSNVVAKNKSIVMGDMNITPWSKTFRQLSNSMESMQNVAQGKGLVFSWNRNVKSSVKLSALIDHIFYSKDISLIEYRIEDTYGSDHNLIYSVFRVPIGKIE